jgi:hypothetical protein
VLVRGEFGVLAGLVGFGLRAERRGELGVCLDRGAPCLFGVSFGLLAPLRFPGHGGPRVGNLLGGFGLDCLDLRRGGLRVSGPLQLHRHLGQLAGQGIDVVANAPGDRDAHATRSRRDRGCQSHREIAR